MIVSFQLIAFLVKYFTPEWQKEVRYITREIVVAMDQITPSGKNAREIAREFVVGNPLLLFSTFLSA